MTSFPVLKSSLGRSTAPHVKNNQVHLSHPRRDKNATHGHRVLSIRFQGNQCPKSSEHSRSGSASTWTQHASDSTERCHSYCSAFFCLTSHTFTFAKTWKSPRDKPSWLYTHSVESAVYTPTHTHWAPVMCSQNTHSEARACLNWIKNVLKSSSGSRWKQMLGLKKVYKLGREITLNTRQVEIPGKNYFQKAVKKIWSNSWDGNSAWRAVREQWQSPTLKRISPVSLKKKKKSKKQPVCELKSGAVRSEYSPACSQLHW